MTVIHVAALVTFTGEALSMKREVVDKGKTVNIKDSTKLTGTESYVQPFSISPTCDGQTQTDRQTDRHKAIANTASCGKN